ncbi:642_t:CDS:2, partial [Cetraspora pellucida]
MYTLFRLAFCEIEIKIIKNLVRNIIENNSQTYQSKALNKDEVVRDEPDSGEFISSSKFWKDSETRIGNNKTSNQVESKIQHIKSDVENQAISKSKKQKGFELNQMYLDELKSLKEAKKVSLDIAKKCLKWEKEKLQELLEWEKQ